MVILRTGSHGERSTEQNFVDASCLNGKMFRTGFAATVCTGGGQEKQLGRSHGKIRYWSEGVIHLGKSTGYIRVVT